MRTHFAVVITNHAAAGSRSHLDKMTMKVLAHMCSRSCSLSDNSTETNKWLQMTTCTCTAPIQEECAECGTTHCAQCWNKRECEQCGIAYCAQCWDTRACSCDHCGSECCDECVVEEECECCGEQFCDQCFENEQIVCTKCESWCCSICADEARFCPECQS